ncbi:MAG: hypothetical protein EOO43_20335 [Flavobacterium sp.]|nr:MAG: hypothetical protein EOO43_20335 [Flavobacterium sp.]
MSWLRELDKYVLISTKLMNRTYLFVGIFFINSGSYCEEHFIGQNVDRRFLNGSDIVMFPEEGVTIEFVSLCLIGLFGLVLISKVLFVKS